MHRRVDLFRASILAQSPWSIPPALPPGLYSVTSAAFPGFSSHDRHREASGP